MTDGTISQEQGGSNLALFDSLFPPNPPTSPAEAKVADHPTWVAPHRTRAISLTSDDWAALVGDPRPDLTPDHALWVALLRRSFAFDGQKVDGCHALAHCLRSEGAALEQRRDRAYLTAGRIAGDTWKAYYLPRLAASREDMIRLLTGVGKGER